MTGKHVAEDMTVATLPAQRLCNEIQLFDLCDLETCSFKEGRFCANAEHLAVFERISDAELRPEVYVSEEPDGDEGECGEEYDDAFEDDAFGDEAESDDGY